MKIRAKITLFISLFLVIPGILLTLLSVTNIKSRGQETLKEYREEAIQTVKLQLKDLVDVAYETVDKNFQNLDDREYLSRYYERQLHDIINTGETIIKRYQRAAANEQITLVEAKQRAKAEIKQLRFDGGTGYIWINDIGKPFPRMIMHPTVPALDGKVLNDVKYNNALGIRKNLFTAFVDVTENGQDGYVDYLWPKPTKEGLTEEKPKLSYVRRYQDWGWILGTGIYIDDAQAETENRVKESIKAMRYANGTGYFWINDNARPFPKMVMHPTIPSLDGKVLDDPKYNNAQGIEKNLFVAFREVTGDADKEGYVDYLWPKPTENGLTERTEKVSYVRLHEPTGWIIGSGAYLDNIDHDIQLKQQEIDNQIERLIVNDIIVLFVFLTLAIFLSYFLAKNIAEPITRLARVADEISHGKNLTAPVMEVGRKDEIGDLAKSVDRLKTSVRIIIERMQKSKPRKAA